MIFWRLVGFVNSSPAFKSKCSSQVKKRSKPLWLITFKKRYNYSSQIDVCTLKMRVGQSILLSSSFQRLIKRKHLAFIDFRTWIFSYQRSSPAAPGFSLRMRTSFFSFHFLNAKTSAVFSLLHQCYLLNRRLNHRSVRARRPHVSFTRLTPKLPL